MCHSWLFGLSSPGAAPEADREGAMKKRQEVMAKQNPEIRAVLTKEQQATFDKNLEEMAKRAAAPRPAPEN